RLSTVMDKLISLNQSAFIKGRQLVDGVVVVNEVIDLARKSRTSCLIFKVDFEKAYNSIRACVFSGNLSVLVNGSPTEEINIQKGLKQGDPLAPFLFLLVVEGLSGAIRSAEEHNLFKGFQVGNTGVSVSHLQYADDTLFLGEATVDNLWTLKAILRSLRACLRP
ncbi:putative non-LTR retroelement reverse transcriptase, partial [Trifolium medium]|nr:putative non-LTR retroelement reverse transcriptase [Trifolium medium]